jgi:ribonuclease HI
MSSPSGMYYSVAVGASPGVYSTEEEANLAKGDHSLSLCVAFKYEDKAREFVDIFKGVDCIVYTDGACVNNGKPGARAGVGVFWGPGDPRNVSRLVHGSPSNNVAELEAILDALQIIAGSPHLYSNPAVIVTDSLYSINCVTTWYSGFVARNWITTTRKPVMNKSLIVDIRKLLDDLPYTTLAHVRGHQGHLGNHAADELAGAPLKL